MYKKLMIVTILAMINSMVCASLNQEDVFQKYEKCGAVLERLALHGLSAITQEEKDATKDTIKEKLQECLLIGSNKKQKQEEKLGALISNDDTVN